MAVLDAKKPAWQASTASLSTTKAEAKTLEGKCPLTVDGGGGLPSGTRLLLKNQTKEAENGLWAVSRNECVGGDGTVGGTGKVGTGETWALERPADADSGADVTNGMLVPIEDGNLNRKTSWIQRTADPIEVGVTAQTFEALVAGSRGTAGGDLVGTYSEPTVAEAVIADNNVSPEAAIGYSKLNLASKVAASDLAVSAKQLSPQLPTPASRKTNFGNVTVEMGAAETTTPYVKVSHELGVKPIAVLPAVNSESTEGAIGGMFAECKGLTETSFEVRGARPFGAPGKAIKFTIGWEANG